MADDKTKRGAADRRLIDFGDRDEVTRACRAMRCTELELWLVHNMLGSTNSRARIRAAMASAKRCLRELRKVWRAKERMDAAERKRGKKAGRR